MERKGFAFYVELEYENIPNFCTFCKTIGHHVDYCKKWPVEDEKNNEKEVIRKKKQPNEPKKVFVQTRDERQEQNKAKDVINVEKEVMEIREQNDKNQDLENSSVNITLKDKGKGHVVEISEEFRKQDEQLEAEINDQLEKETNLPTAEKELSSSSTQGSFVDAIQIQDDTLSTDDEVQSGSSQQMKTQKEF